MDSNSASSTATTLLTLPAELRNRIYSILFEFPTPVRVVYERSSQGMRGHKLRLDESVPIEWSVFGACRMLNEEAASLFYKNNSFLLTKAPYCRELHVCLITAFQTFLDALGSQASLLRNVRLDLNGVCGWLCHRSSKAIIPLFPEERRIVDITLLLRAAWKHSPQVRLSFVHSLDKRTLDAHDPYADCDAPAMTKLIGFLLNNGLNLQGYKDLALKIGIQRDGRGGMVIWNSPIRLDYETWFLRSAQLNRIPMHTSNFATIHEDSTPSFLKEHRTFTRLHQYLQDKILHYALEDGLNIDLDVDTTLPYAPICINRDTYSRWRDRFVTDNPLIITMATNEARSTFSSFVELRRLLRNKFVESPKNYTEGMLSPQHGLEVILDFKLNRSFTLENIRVSILPLIMETCEGLGTAVLRIRIREPDHGLVLQQHVIKFQELRTNIAKALMNVVFLGEHKAAPETWINGFGNVIEVQEHPRPDRINLPNMMPDMASDVVYDAERGFKIVKVHRLDTLNRWQWHDSDRSECVFENCDQFFPFHHSASETLRFVLGLLQATGDWTSDWRRDV